MASGLYNAFVQSYMTQGANQVDLDADDIRVILVDNADYTVDLVNHDFLDDVPAAARVAVSGNLANKSVTARVFDADDIVISSVSGDGTESVIIYKHTGTESTSRLIAYFDNAGVALTPNGNNITVSWDNGANKIFKL